MDGGKTGTGQDGRRRMDAIKERLRPHLDENLVALRLEKWLQI
jgi:hypothetical protein